VAFEVDSTSVEPGGPSGGSVRLRSVRLRSVRPGSVRLDSVRLDSVRLDSVRLDSVKLGSVRLGSVGLGSVGLGSVGLGAIAASLSPGGSGAAGGNDEGDGGRDVTGFVGAAPGESDDAEEGSGPGRPAFGGVFSLMSMGRRVSYAKR
jgi:hypothetical protein